MTKIKQFIEDFKESAVYNSIVQDESVDIIMLWLTGSALLTPQANNGDYDVCVLVREKPEESSTALYKVYSRPGSYFVHYQPQGKTAQWIYNDISDITSITSTPLDNIGWAQFKYIKESDIFYRNPEYNDFIDMLLTSKDEVSKYALYLFAVSATEYFQKCMINDDIRAFRRNFEKPAKILGHICWAADLLQGKEPDEEKIETIKRELLENVPEDYYKYILDSADFLATYIQKTPADLPKKPELICDKVV